MDFKYNDVEPEHLGGGVVLFRNAISFDSETACRYAEEQIASEQADMYTEIIHPETGEKAFANRSKYIFDYDGIMSMPRRGSKVHHTEHKEFREFLTFVEESKDKYLLKYFFLFPISYKTVWWKVKGHLVSYSTEYGGKHLGQHCDTSAEYSYGIDHPQEQLATRSTISTLVYLNDNFKGGNHYFNYLDIEYVPHAGDIMFFPSNYMATHEVKHIEGGSRYTYLGWYSHGSPNSEYNEHIVDPIKHPEMAEYATNVYMPTLRQDFKSYLELVDPGKLNHGHKLVEKING
jgi:hypothetical protein